MKTLEIKQTKVKLPDKENGGMKDSDYKDLIISCLDHPPQGGFDRAILAERRRIEDAMEGSNGFVDFEDNDAKKLQQIVGQMKWGVRNEEIEEFLDAIDEMPDKEKEVEADD